MICPYGCKPHWRGSMDFDGPVLDGVELCAVHSLTERLAQALSDLYADEAIIVYGDGPQYQNPDSKMRVNQSIAWVAMCPDKASHKVKARLDALKAALSEYEAARESKCPR